MAKSFPFNPCTHTKIFRSSQPESLEREFKRWAETFTGAMTAPPQVTAVGNEIVICVFYEMPQDA